MDDVGGPRREMSTQPACIRRQRRGASRERCQRGRCGAARLTDGREAGGIGSTQTSAPSAATSAVSGPSARHTTESAHCACRVRSAAMLSRSTRSAPPRPAETLRNEIRISASRRLPWRLPRRSGPGRRLCVVAAVLLAVVRGVVVRVPLDVDAVQHGANHVRLHRVQLVDRRASPCSASSGPRRRRRRRRRPRWRAPTRPPRPAPAANRSRPSRSARPASRGTPRTASTRAAPPGSAGSCLRAARTDSARPVLRTASLGLQSPTSRFEKPGLLRHIEDLVDARPPHVGVDVQHALAGLRQRHRQVAREQALAFARPGAGDDDDAHALLGRREQHVGAHRADRLGEVRAARRRVSSAGPLSSIRRHHARGTARSARAQFLRRLDAVVEVLEQEHEAAAARTEPASSRHRQVVARAVAGTGLVGHLRGIDDADVARLELARDARSPSCAAAAIRRPAGCSRPRAAARCTRCPCGSGSAPRSSAPRARRPGCLSCASAADRTRSAPTPRPCRSRSRALPRPTAWPCAILTISGWRSPYFSASCACWR